MRRPWTALTSAYTFARTGAAERTQTARLSASGGAVNDQLGVSVAIEGDAIVAGAPLDDVGTNADQGSAYTFARTGAAERTETAKLTAADGAANDRLGVSVAIEGDAIVAGAPLDDVGANVNQGSASIFFAAPPGGGATPPAAARPRPAAACPRAPMTMGSGKTTRRPQSTTEACEATRRDAQGARQAVASFPSPGSPC